MASKVQKCHGNLGEDRISQLPDDVLLRVLSLLDDTILAVKTTILSKRWNNLWASISSIQLNNNYKYGNDRFLTGVDRVVSLHDSTDIKKFSPSYYIGRRGKFLADDYNRISRCISTVVEKNIVELDFNFYSRNGANWSVLFYFPESLFQCRTLVVLKMLTDRISFSNCPTTGCFPNLKVLHIGSYHPSDESFQVLFTCCPILEDLTIYGVLKDVPDITFSAPNLRTLKIHLNTEDGSFPPSFFIDAPKLESFDVDDRYFHSNYHLVSGKSLKRAKISLHHFIYEDDSPLGCIADRATALCAKIINVEYLWLDVEYVNGSCQLPEFVNLNRLVLFLYNLDYWEFLIECLKRCPNLKHLVLEHDKYYVDHELEWEISNPTECPGCLAHLQTISIKGFRGLQDEMGVARYLLKNGEVLHMMSIHTVRYKHHFLYSKEELYRKFLTYDRGSGSCVIEIN